LLLKRPTSGRVAIIGARSSTRMAADHGALRLAVPRAKA
jgi:hypothetical protein